jgi:hypothetical protein
MNLGRIVRIYRAQEYWSRKRTTTFIARLHTLSDKNSIKSALKLQSKTNLGA